MAKYRLLRERVAAAATELGIELMLPEPADNGMLERVHCAEYINRVQQGTLSASELRRIGFPWSPAMPERSRRVSAATSQALLAALNEGVAMNLAGGTHHAKRDQGGGYCIFNDTVVAARHAQALGAVRRVLVIDLDVHHGNGTAALTRDDPSIFTFDIYAARNYPAFKEAVDLAVPLPDGCDDQHYLAALQHHLPQAIDAAKADAAIYLAGADPYQGDRLGYLSLSKAGLLARDEYVLRCCKEAGLPVAISMAGGYADQVNDIVDIHFATVGAARLAATGWFAECSKELAVR